MGFCGLLQGELYLFLPSVSYFFLSFLAISNSLVLILFSISSTVKKERIEVGGMRDIYVRIITD
jgi:hypothetical protein